MCIDFLAYELYGTLRVINSYNIRVIINSEIEDRLPCLRKH